MPESRPDRTAASDSSGRWIIPVLLAAAVITPVAILIASNTESAAIAWAGFRWEAPTWIVLFVTFVAGILAAPLFSWGWRRWRKRRRRLADEREVLRKHGE